MRAATRRDLRAVSVRFGEARLARTEAIVAAHAAGAEIPEIGRELGMDAFDVRDVLAKAGVLPALKPKETVSGAAARAGAGAPPTAPAPSGGRGAR